MRVLDIGSGMGDVALLAADIVGPGGRVLGIDRDATVLEHARRRVIEQGCSTWVSFEAANLNEFKTADQFDALVGRYVLLYQPDAAATIRYLLQYVRSGGLVIFHDIDFSRPAPQLSAVPPLRSSLCFAG
jgi:ubiquinone/menaquinone biosynthesis C-methylase UbiE